MEYDLRTVIKYCFDDSYGITASTIPHLGTIEKYAFMEIPVSEDTVDIPTFVFRRFVDRMLPDQNSIGLIAVNLKNNVDAISKYKSVDSAARNLLRSDFKNNFLVRFPMKDSSDPVFYGTQGAIFDADFNPWVMLLWRLSKKFDLQGSLKYKFVEPVVRVSPKVFLAENSAIKRYIINKIVPTALSIENIYTPYFSSVYSSSDNFGQWLKIKVEIGDCPFVIRQANVPSVSTTNEELLHVALDNLDELVQ